MRCRNCHYALWNLKTRTCPECGAAFSPGEHDFTPGSVRFLCPHCAQAYYGTDARGHLDPPAFECVSCGREISMNDMIVQPAGGADGAPTSRDRMPWLERGEKGIVRAWFATLGRAMTAPTSLMRAMPEEATLGGAWAFMFVSNLLFSLVGLIIPGIIVLIVISQFLNSLPQGGMPPFLRTFIVQQTLWQQAIAIAALAFGPVLWIWMTHGLLVLTGGAPGGLRRTWHAICYSSGANALAAIPCSCAGYGGLIWWFVSAILMVKEGHQIRGGRASFAVITSGAVIALGLVIVLFGAALLPMGGFAVLKNRYSLTETMTVTRAVIAYASETGAPPRHASELIARGSCSSWSFALPQTGTTPANIPFNGGTLDALEAMSPQERQRAAAQAANALPADVIAHRLGDFVFTHHGVDLSAPDGDLWLVIMTPDPDLNAALQPFEAVQVGRADGSVHSMAYLEFQQEISDQNRLRQQYGLAPLPDPQTVTHAKPAPGSAGRTDEAGRASD